MLSVREAGGIVAMVLIAFTALFAFGVMDPTTIANTGGQAAAAGAGSGTVDAVGASARGKELYLSSCASCHGPDGRGTERGPTLERAGAADFDFYLRSGRMPLEDPAQPLEPGPPAYDDADIAALVAYGRELGDGPEIPRLVTGMEQPVGRELFVNDCAACHGVTASGAAIGPDAFAPSLRGVDPRLIREAPLVGPGTMPVFDLDDEQLSAIAQYVEGVSTEGQHGGFELRGFGPVAEGLVALFLGLFAILLLARWVGSSDETSPSASEGRDHE